MRTKTLILSAVAGFIGCAAALADTNVYSLNAVGYINVTCPHGFTMIANQLNTTNNALKYLLPNPDSGDGVNGVYEGVQLYKWTGTTYALDTGDFLGGQGTTGWDNGGVLTLNPGEASWLFNPRSTNMIITFVGEVVQGTQTNTLNANFTMRSSIVPQAGGISTVLGLVNADSGDHNNGTLEGDQIYIWTPGVGGGYSAYTGDFLGGVNGWDSTEPVLGVGQGFFYHAGADRQWVRTFSANN